VKKEMMNLMEKKYNDFDKYNWMKQRISLTTAMLSLIPHVKIALLR
jgi:hypothetical protein